MACSICAQGTYSLGGTQSTCLSCISASCATCRPTDGICLSCNPGYNWNGLIVILGNACSACSPGFFSLGGQNQCTVCTSMSCATCDPINGLCTGCNAGYGWDSSTRTCNPCSNGQFSLGGTSLCLACTVLGINGCSSCDPTNNRCTSCLPGFYSTGLTVNCVVCPENTFSFGGNIQQCLACNNACGTCNPQTGFCTSCYPGYSWNR